MWWYIFLLFQMLDSYSVNFIRLEGFFLFSSLFNIFIKFSLSTRFYFGDQSWWLIQNSTFKMFSQILQTSWLQPSVVQLASGSTFPSFQHLIRQLIEKHIENGEGGKGGGVWLTVRNSDCTALWPLYLTRKELLISVPIGLDFNKEIFCGISFNSTLYYSEGKSIYQEQ